MRRMARGLAVLLAAASTTSSTTLIQLGDLKPPVPDVNVYADFTLAEKAARYLGGGS